MAAEVPGKHSDFLAWFSFGEAGEFIDIRHPKEDRRRLHLMGRLNPKEKRVEVTVFFLKEISGDEKRKNSYFLTEDRLLLEARASAPRGADFYAHSVVWFREDGEEMRMPKEKLSEYKQVMLMPMMKEGKIRATEGRRCIRAVAEVFRKLFPSLDPTTGVIQLLAAPSTPPAASEERKGRPESTDSP